MHQTLFVTRPETTDGSSLSVFPSPSSLDGHYAFMVHPRPCPSASVHPSVAPVALHYLGATFLKSVAIIACMG